MSFPWFDKLSGNSFDLPYVPQTREELESMLADLRAKKEMEVSPPTGRFADDIGPALRTAADTDIGKFAISEKHPGDVLQRKAGELGAGFVSSLPFGIRQGAEAIARRVMPEPNLGEMFPVEDHEGPRGLPSVSSINPDEAQESEQRFQQQIEARKGPAALAGAGRVVGEFAGDPTNIAIAAIIAAEPALAPIISRAFSLDMGAAAIKDVTEGKYGPAAAEAAMSALIGAHGWKGIGGSVSKELNPSVLPSIEDVAPYVEDTARGLGYTDIPTPVSRMVPEGPQVPEGYVRVYRSGEGNYFTTNESRAGSYEGEGSYVDIPKEVFDAGQIEAAKYGQPTPQDTYLPNEWVNKAQRAKLQRETFDATEEVDADALFEELGIKRVGAEGTPAVPTDELGIVEDFPTPEGTVGQVPQKMIPPDMVLDPETKTWVTKEQAAVYEAQRQLDIKISQENVDDLGRPLGAVQPRSVIPPEDNPPIEGVVPVQRGVQGVQPAVQPGQMPGNPGGAGPLEVTAGTIEPEIVTRFDKGQAPISPEELAKIELLIKEPPSESPTSRVWNIAEDAKPPGSLMKMRSTPENVIDTEAPPELGGAGSLSPKDLIDLDNFEAKAEQTFGPDWRNVAPDEIKLAHERLISNVNANAENPAMRIEVGKAGPFTQEQQAIKDTANYIERTKGEMIPGEVPIEDIVKEAGLESTPPIEAGEQVGLAREAGGLKEPRSETIKPTPPLPTGALEGAPPPKKGQTFAEFMTAKFGEKTTTSKERAIARAEWNRAREERKMIKLAEEAGIPPDKLKAMLEGTPKEGGPEAEGLSRWRRAVMPVIENFESVHPWLKKQFTKYIDDAETPAMKNIADSWRIKKSLAKPEQRMVIDILDGKKVIDEKTPVNVRSAAINYRAMLDQTWSDAISAGVRKAADRKRQTYFPHKFAEGWDDNLVQNLHMDKNWNMRESSLEKARLSKRADYRRDLDVLDEYFLSAYRRISEVQNFGKRLEVLRSFAKKHVTDKATAEWLQMNIRRVMGREHPGGFERFSGHARHVQALSDLGFAAFYQPVQATNTALYGGLGRSLRALKAVVKNAPDEIYDAIRSRALVPDITQELVAGAYGAREGIPSRALQKFMWGIPTIDRWTRIHANTVGKLMVGDAMKGGWGSKGALKDIKGLGFDINNLADLQKAIDIDPDFALKVGKELSDKALFRSGAMELPGWTSSTSGKLATQYTRFMYRHSLFVRDIFTQARQGNIRPLARLLTVAPVAITGFSEVLFPIREGLREIIRQKVSDEDLDMDQVIGSATGDENLWDEEVQWYHILRNKRIPWTHPLKRSLQNVSMWGGIGVFQMAIERILGASGSPIEVGTKALSGPVAGNIAEGVGSLIKDVNRLPEDVEWQETPGRNTTRWGAQQIPIAGYPIARRLREELDQ